MRFLLVWAALLPAIGAAQDRPNEADLFGSDDAPVVEDAGVVDAGEPTFVPVDPNDRDYAQLNAPETKSKFDTAEAVSDPLKIGGTLLMYGQGYFQENKPFVEGAFSAPILLDMYLDGRPTDRLRAFVDARLQFDPTRPTSGANTTTTANGTSTTSSSFVGLTPATSSNPSVLLDQLWLRFDIARRVYMTVGRQKVRWGVSRIWYPTDYLNSRPRDALNPFDVRLGVNMVKVHVPVESLGWNFYGYGLLDAVNVSSSGIQLKQLGGAVRGEFVLGPAEIGIGGVWQEGRRQRYALDISSAVGPVDVYAEAAFRDGQDFVYFNLPDGLTDSNLIQNIGNISARQGSGIVVQASGGASYQFNYTDKNFAILGVEYFYNPAGYEKPVGYQVQQFAPQALGVTLDAIQNVALYQGKHNLAVTLAAPGIPGFDWITVSLSNIVIISDPAALTRLDVIFRVLNYLSVQAFGSVFYGAPGGQLRFRLTAQTINGIANLSEAANPGSGDGIRSQLSGLREPPIVQAGVLLRLAI